MGTAETLIATRISRRRLLALGALGALPIALTACQSSSARHPSATPSPTTAPTPTPTNPPPLTSADWDALARQLQGTLVRPDSPRYATARQLYNSRFDGISPAGIAYCASAADVQTCLAFARQFELPVVPRSGGHSYAGYSTTTGLVLDVTRLSGVNVDASAGTVVVGAGAHLIDVYAALAAQGRVLPAGSCSTVGIAGLTLGGGIGVLGRKFGLTCDNLLSAQIVAADGRALTCDAGHEPDLFWALRGGGGGNFGVVTSFTFRTHLVSALTLFTFDWPWTSAAQIVAAWQGWAPHAPDELWSNCLLLTTGNPQAAPLARVNGVYVGGEGALQGLLQQLTSQIGVAPLSAFVGSDSILDALLIEAGCYGETVQECHLPSQNGQGRLTRAMFAAKSDYFASRLPSAGITALVSAVATRQGSAAGGGGISLDAMGGVINRVASDATAFVHRQELFSAQYAASWSAGAPPGVVSASERWLTDTWQAMRPYATGAAYQNYIDPDLDNWAYAYYGANLLRLLRVKATYDPGNVFAFPQSIPVLAVAEGS
jgi:FAD/FMN-containing dehydrogenase